MIGSSKTCGRISMKMAQGTESIHIWIQILLTYSWLFLAQISQDGVAQAGRWWERVWVTCREWLCSRCSVNGSPALVGEEQEHRFWKWSLSMPLNWKWETLGGTDEEGTRVMHCVLRSCSFGFTWSIKMSKCVLLWKSINSSWMKWAFWEHKASRFKECETQTASNLQNLWFPHRVVCF